MFQVSVLCRTVSSVIDGHQTSSFWRRIGLDNRFGVMVDFCWYSIQEMLLPLWVVASGAKFVRPRCESCNIIGGFERVPLDNAEPRFRKPDVGLMIHVSAYNPKSLSKSGVAKADYNCVR